MRLEVRDDIIVTKHIKWCRLCKWLLIYTWTHAYLYHVIILYIVINAFSKALLNEYKSFMNKNILEGFSHKSNNETVILKWINWCVVLILHFDKFIMMIFFYESCIPYHWAKVGMIQNITIIVYCKRVTIDSKLKIYNKRSLNLIWWHKKFWLESQFSVIHFNLPDLAGLVFQFHLLVRQCQRLLEAQQFEPSKDIKDKL